MPETHDCGGDAAAYVLGALEPAEVETFTRHLEECVVCRDEVAALKGVVQALPMAAPQHPVPVRLRANVLRALHQDVRPLAPSPTRRTRSSGRALWWRPAAVAGACAAVALAVFAGLQLRGGAELHVIPAHVAGISGSASLHLSGGRGELIVHHLSPPPPGKVYEMWLQRPGRAPAPTNVLFSVTSTGAGDIGLPSKLQGVTEILVTPEPKGGSKVPTHAPVIVARLASNE